MTSTELVGVQTELANARDRVFNRYDESKAPNERDRLYFMYEYLRAASASIGKIVSAMREGEDL